MIRQTFPLCAVNLPISLRVEAGFSIGKYKPCGVKEQSRPAIADGVFALYLHLPPKLVDLTLSIASHLIALRTLKLSKAKTKAWLPQ